MQKSSQKSKPGEFTFDDLVDRVVAGQPKKKGKRLTPQRLRQEIQARTEERQQIQERAAEWGRELRSGARAEDIQPDLLRSFEQDAGLQAGAVGVAGAVLTTVRSPRVVWAADYQGTFTGPKFEDVNSAARMAEVKPFEKPFDKIDNPFEKNAAFRRELGEALDWSANSISLAGSWRFEEIAKYARSRPGHNFVTWPYVSFADGAWKTARDLVEAARLLHPSVSNEGIAMLCLSVQSRQHAKDVFKLFGDSNEARALARRFYESDEMREIGFAAGGERLTAQLFAELAEFRAIDLLAQYARVLHAPSVPEAIAQVVENAAASISTAGEQPRYVAKHGRAAIDDGRRNRAIVRIAEAIPNWRHNLGELAETLDASAEQPKAPGDAQTWVNYYGGLAPRHFRKKIQDAFDWCSDHPQVANSH